LNKGMISVNLILCILVSIIAVLPPIQEGMDISCCYPVGKPKIAEKAVGLNVFLTIWHYI